MATQKVWTVTACSAEYEPDEDEDEEGECMVAGEEITVQAHQATIEPSGALTFWAVTADNMQAVMLFAFSPSEWTRLVYVGLAKEG